MNKALQWKASTKCPIKKDAKLVYKTTHENMKNSVN